MDQQLIKQNNKDNSSTQNKKNIKKSPPKPYRKSSKLKHLKCN